MPQLDMFNYNMIFPIFILLFFFFLMISLNFFYFNKNFILNKNLSLKKMSMKSIKFCFNY